MESVGGSIGCAGIGSVTDGSQSVSATRRLRQPGDARRCRRPRPGRSARRSSPRKASTLETRNVSTVSPVARQRLHRLPGLHRAGADAAGQQAAEEGVGLERRRQHAERAGLDVRRRDVREHHVEERRDRSPSGRPASAPSSPAWRSRRARGNRAARRSRRARRRGRRRRSARRRAARRAVDLVDDDDRLQPDRERLRSARTWSAASALRRHRPAGSRRRPCSGCAPPRRRNRRGRACRRC